MNLVDALPKTTTGRAIGNQLVRSGTSVGANYRAACRGRSKAEFIAKIGTVAEEADESGFWMELIIEGGLLPDPLVAPLLKEADELTAIFTASARTAKAHNLKSEIQNMLDTDTKRRIDTARDILVGKVPDPKSQVEQITIAFFKVENDGFGLGAQRRAFDKNDLPQVQAELAAYLQALRTASPTEASAKVGQIVPKEKIAANGDYNLSGERYREGIVAVDHYPAKPLSDLLEIQSGYPFKSDLFNEETGFPIIRIRDIKPNRTVTKYTGEYDPAFLVKNGDLLIGMDGEFNPVIWNGGPALLNQRVSKLHSFTGCLKEYVALLIPKKLQEIEDGTYAVTVKHISGKQISAIEIPLPPLEVQKEIVAEIEAEQSLVAANRELITSFEHKIQATLARIWGEETPATPEA